MRKITGEEGNRMKKFSIDMTIREALNHPVGIGLYALMCTGTIFMMVEAINRACTKYEDRLTLKCAKEIMDDLDKKFTVEYEDCEEDEN